MQASVDLPKAFSVRDNRQLSLIQELMARLNPKLLVIQVATGLHVDGCSTVNWGLVYLDAIRSMNRRCTPHWRKPDWISNTTRKSSTADFSQVNRM